MLDALARWEAAPRFRVDPALTIHDVLPARMREAVTALVADPAWDLALEQDRTGALRDDAGDLTSDQIGAVLHRLRRRAKRVRYQVEVAAPLLAWDERAALAALVELQDVLGELQDVRVVEAWRDALDHDERPREEFDEWLVGRRQAALRRWRVVQRERLAPVVALAAAAAPKAPDAPVAP
jgi:CHAD domain-containing protein